MTTNRAGGCPESAWVDLAALGDGRPVFGTHERSRRYENLLADPQVSLVLVSGTGQELQLEGEAAVPAGADARAVEELLESRHPGATGRPSTRLVTVRTRWGRCVDVAADPPLREEFPLRGRPGPGASRRPARPAARPCRPARWDRASLRGRRSRGSSG